MKAEQLQVMFPAGVQLPDTLSKLCQYSEQDKDYICCDFKLIANRYGISQAFRDVKDESKHMAIFGRDGHQSLYGYWMYGEHSVDQAPIVYVHHEGVGTAVIANTLEELLSLLALGYEEIGLVTAWQMQEQERKVPCEGIDRFRVWLESELGVRPAADGRAVIARAQQAHPDFAAWLQGQREQAAPQP